MTLAAGQCHGECEHLPWVDDSRREAANGYNLFAHDLVTGIQIQAHKMLALLLSDVGQVVQAIPWCADDGA